MRPVDKSLYKEHQETYTPYGEAKNALFEALGPFCSYCERHGYSSALAVEHIEDKNNNPDKEFSWDNFLLSCNNCNSIKGTKDIDFEKTLLPHLNNTFEVFSYLENGAIIINPEINASSKEKAKELLELVGIDRLPGDPKYSKKDNRWKERMEVWKTAKIYLSKFENGPCDVEMMIELALTSGFWSIWMTVFSDHYEIKKQLVHKFKGTKLEYFDIQV